MKSDTELSTGDFENNEIVAKQVKEFLKTKELPKWLGKGGFTKL